MRVCGVWMRVGARIKGWGPPPQCLKARRKSVTLSLGASLCPYGSAYSIRNNISKGPAPSRCPPPIRGAGVCVWGRGGQLGCQSSDAVH